MGELDFTYDDSLLQGEEEEDTAVLTTQQKEQEDQEVFAVWAVSLGITSQGPSMQLKAALHQTATQQIF